MKLKSVEVFGQTVDVDAEQMYAVVTERSVRPRAVCYSIVLLSSNPVYQVYCVPTQEGETVMALNPTGIVRPEESQPDRNKITGALATILAEVTKIVYSPGEESDELDNAREAASILIEMAGFDLDDSDGMGQPMGVNVLGLILAACHLAPQMRDRLLGRDDNVHIEALEA